MNTDSEPFNGINPVEFGDYTFMIKFSPDRTIKFISSLGKNKLNSYKIISMMD